MLETIMLWFKAHYIEVIASILGTISVFFAMKQKIYYWIFMFLNASLYLFVYYNSELYALMFTQMYFIVSSIVGLYFWTKKTDGKQKKKLAISHIPRKRIFVYSLVFVAMYVAILLILINLDKILLLFNISYTNELKELNYIFNFKVVYFDALVTSGSFISLYFMVKKYFEAWIAWIITDIFTIYLCIDQALYPTAIMFTFYLIFSIMGHYAWKKYLKK